MRGSVLPRLEFDAAWVQWSSGSVAPAARLPLGTSDDYKTERMPGVNAGKLEGQLAWRQHDGGHTDGPNWKYFIPWTDRFLG